jgi:hypothetical protein
VCVWHVLYRITWANNGAQQQVSVHIQAYSKSFQTEVQKQI